MFVCASTECFPELSPKETLARLVDLEYTVVELAIHETDGWLKPSEVLADLERAVNLCRETHRMSVAALSINIEAEGDAYYEQFAACCKLAKAIKVVTMVVPSAELGAPFNEEVERLRKLSAIASLEGAVAALKTQVDRMSQDVDTAQMFCNNVPGLKLTLDPSCMIFGPNQNRGYDKLIEHVQHVHLRDTSKNELQVRVGQGEIDYGKLVSQLNAARYNRALSVNMTPMADVDHEGEMRKIRLLLDSLLQSGIATVRQKMSRTRQLELSSGTHRKTDVVSLSWLGHRLVHATAGARHSCKRVQFLPRRVQLLCRVLVANRPVRGVDLVSAALGSSPFSSLLPNSGTRRIHVPLAARHSISSTIEGTVRLLRNRGTGDLESLAQLGHQCI